MDWNEQEQRNLIVEIGRRMWMRGYVAANDGNMTVRISEKAVLTTPAGVSKGFLTPEMILKIDLDGREIISDTTYRPSSEIKMHLEVYSQRKDIRAVVHAHPPYSTGLAVAGIPPDTNILPEAVLALGNVPIAPYGTPSTEEIPESIRPWIKKSDALLLANHGALTLGADLSAAYHRMEVLEHTAMVFFLSMQLGNARAIPKNGLKKINYHRHRRWFDYYP
jgi:L-fuculose-phosphate aldolase